MIRRRERVTRLFQEFIRSEQSSGIILMTSAVVALILMNSTIGPYYQALLDTELGWEGWGIHLKHDITHWINDGLMTIFFLLIGLEIERELYKGELSDLRGAMLPLLAAVGGMLVPALIHFSLNYNLPTEKGFGIPMATDIAFALGVLSLLGKRVPPSLKVFLTAFAIIDDIGAMIIIAIFYTSDLSFIYLLLAIAIFLGLGLLNRYKVRNMWFYLLPGVVMWYFMMESGVHATLAGVLLAFALPFQDGGPDSTSSKVEHALNKPVAYLIMPIFALANAGVAFTANFFSQAITPNTVGIFFGLLIGKPLGILSFSYLGIWTKFVKLPEAMSFKHMLGAGFLGGIGFTMSMFITILAFGHTSIAANSKLSIMLASLAAGTIGYFALKFRRPVRRHPKYKNPEGPDEEPTVDATSPRTGSWLPVEAEAIPESLPNQKVEESLPNQEPPIQIWETPDEGQTQPFSRLQTAEEEKLVPPEPTPTVSESHEEIKTGEADEKTNKPKSVDWTAE